jgi:hypothetical protein
MDFKEQFLYHIWDGQHLKKKLKTITEEKIEVIFPGNWNTNRGPDFKNAVIKIDGKIKHGDVEIHRKSNEWKLHKHNEDPNFNSVILHVVYLFNEKIPYTIKEDSEKIPIFEMKSFLDENIKKLLEKYSEEEFVPQAEKCLINENHTEKEIERFIYSLGVKRIEKRKNRLNTELLFIDFNQMIYSGIFRGLGYSKNKFQMEKLSEELNYHLLKTLFENKIPPQTILSILLFSSNLIKPFSSFHKKYQNLYDEFQKQNVFKTDLNINWNLFRIRPSNHPVNRIVNVFPFLLKTFETNLLNEILKIFIFKNNCYDEKQVLEKWYNLFKINNKNTIGKNRLNTIFYNIILPIINLYAIKMGYDLLAKYTNLHILNFKKLTQNNILQIMDKFIPEKYNSPNLEIYNQGKIFLYYTFCQYHFCESCKIEILKLKD